MNPDEYEAMFRAQDSLWWYRGMERITRGILNRHYRPGSGLKILDAGCGTGASFRLLSEYGDLTALDFSPLALGFCRKQAADRLIRGTVNQLPLQTGVFDLVVSFDVICCLGVNDEAALGEFERVLRPGGRLLLRLPAYNWLRGAHDRAVDIRERYTAASLKRRLRGAGFDVERTTYANTLLFPLAALKRLGEHAFNSPRRTSDLTLNYGRLQGLFEAVLSSEAALLPLIRLPFGLTIVAVGKKDEAIANEP
ncbi:MAG: class I SAM-dependent methyltransferase [Acidobacteria bacterium]|nr:MAG: class I SAM-dependent methyltransferase [Acidobacteriota bacterium]